jgi:Flp pilus assembly protein TadG
MIHVIHRRQGRTAVAAVEFAVILPVILTLLLGIWEVGRMIEIQQILYNAAREGGRQAATGQLTNSEVQDTVVDCLSTSGLPTSNVVVTVKDLDTPANDVSNANYLDRIQITATIPIADIRWSLISMVTKPGQLMTSQVEWVTMVDKPYPSFPTPPVGWRQEGPRNSALSLQRLCTLRRRN